MNPHFSEIGKILIEVVPSIAGLFFSPYAGLGLHLVAQAIGLEKTSPSAVLDALKASDGDKWTDKLKLYEKNNQPLISFLSTLKMPTKVNASVEIQF